MSKEFENWCTNGEYPYHAQENHIALKDAFEAGRAVGSKEASTPPTYAQGQEVERWECPACENLLDSEHGARNCCAVFNPDVEITKWVCIRALPTKEGE